MIVELARPLAAVSLAVVGAPHVPERKFEILLCDPGEPVQLVPEPKNKHDENAIAVFSARGVQIGYLAAERAPRIGQLIRQGTDVVAIFQRASSFGALIRVGFDGAAPALPRAQESEPIEPDDGWFPDEVWPDE